MWIRQIWNVYVISIQYLTSGVYFVIVSTVIFTYFQHR